MSLATTKVWWTLPAAWAAVAVLPYPLLSGPAQVSSYLLTAAGVVVALVVGLRLNPPSRPAPWRLIVAAYGCLVFADAVSYGDSLPGALGGTSFYLSTAAYLAFYVLVVAALAQLPRRNPDHDLSAWLDASIWTVGTGLLVWLWAVEPAVQTAGVVDVVSLAYPVMDLALLLILVRLIGGSLRDNPCLVLLTLAMTAQLVTDLLYLVTGASMYASGGVLDVGWLVSYALMAASALHPSLATSTCAVVGRGPSRFGTWRLPLLMVPACVGPLTVVWLVATGRVGGEVDDVVVAMVAALVILALGALRGNDVIRMSNRRADALQAQVDHDALTGLLSREGFVRAMGEASASVADQEGSWAVLLLDLDDFKTVNDTRGHDAGDTLLVAVADRLRTVHRGYPTSLARFGGDEFAMLVRSADVADVVSRVLDVIATPVTLDGGPVQLHVSIGSASIETGLSDVEVLRHVDVAMYDAKRSAATWRAYEPQMSERLVAALDVRDRLADGLAAGEVAAHFQPVFDLCSGDLRGFEALARWTMPGRGLLPTAQWLPLAEQSDLVVDVDRCVVKAAIDRLAHWQRTFGVDDLHMAVNLSGRTLRQPGFEDWLLAALHVARLPGDRLVVEVTEGVQIVGDDVGHRLQRLRAGGVRIALDDFGTGWSSLSYLRSFPVDRLKLDCSFTFELSQGGLAAQAIPAAVIQLATALDLDVVAEGVETLAQRDLLMDLGFGLGQGYVCAPAMTAEAAEAWVRRVAPAAGVAHDVVR